MTTSTATTLEFNVRRLPYIGEDHDFLPDEYGLYCITCGLPAEGRLHVGPRVSKIIVTVYEEAS